MVMWQQRRRCTWGVRVVYVERPWAAREKSDGRPWVPHELSVGHLWGISEAPIGPPWGVGRAPMGRSRGGLVSPVRCTWVAREVSVGRPRVGRGAAAR